jgi:tetraprenyl-beta-curcumene synthase
MPAAGRELHQWHARAAGIPDEVLRRDALSALDRKRGNTHGAGMFWTLPRTRSTCLLRLLVTYQIMWDYLDTASESGATVGQINGLQLHLALVDALDPDRPISDYYCHHPWHEDGGYLRALVHACRQCCLQLPSFQRVRPLLVREATRANVQAINHDPNPADRELGLREWAADEFPNGHEVWWFELTAAAGAGLVIYALFALAAEPACDGTQIAQAYQAYFPWTSALATMLDSFVDQEEDAANGDHCYVAYYETTELATQHIARLIQRCLYETQNLDNSERHTLIAACMVAMYLSKDSARTPAVCARTQHLVNAGGSLTRFLLPILRVWRIALHQRST